jgi:hypothetical protein
VRPIRRDEFFHRMSLTLNHFSRLPGFTALDTCERLEFHRVENKTKDRSEHTRPPERRLISWDCSLLKVGAVKRPSAIRVSVELFK